METKYLSDLSELIDKVRPILEEIKTSHIKDIKIEYGDRTKLITSLQVDKFLIKIDYTNVSVYISIYYKSIQVEDLKLSDSSLSVKISSLFSEQINNLKTNIKNEWYGLLSKSY